MKLLLRRDQKSGMIALMRVTFIMDIRAELTDEELNNIKKYKLGNTMLYERYTMRDGGKGILGFIWRIFFHMRNLTISVNDLTSGKRIDCKDILDMLDTEAHVKEACGTFKAILTAASQFGGEEIIEY